MDPTWVATGLKVELDTLVVECKLVYDQIGEIISLDGENDNKVTSFAEFSNEFENMDFSWKGCVTSIHLKEEFVEVDEAAETLYIVVSPFLLKLVILVIISLDCYIGMACFYCAHLVVSVQSLPHDPHEMKVITAYLLAVLGGNASPSAKDLKGILGSIGVDHDNDMIEHLLTQEHCSSSPWAKWGGPISCGKPGGDRPTLVGYARLLRYKCAGQTSTHNLGFEVELGSGIDSLHQIGIRAGCGSGPLRVGGWCRSTAHPAPGPSGEDPLAAARALTACITSGGAVAVASAAAGVGGGAAASAAAEPKKEESRIEGGVG
ncbi:hypothetical protein ACS0TY_022560 [Phlomoides rotata]